MRQKLRPKLLEEKDPMTAPSRAIGTISQFAHPRNGMIVGIIRIRAIMPTMDANMLSMGRKMRRSALSGKTFVRLRRCDRLYALAFRLIPNGNLTQIRHAIDPD
jgi:hypothetical protein